MTYQDNFGANEDKKFHVYFKTHIAPILDDKNHEYYIVRNGWIADLAIYSFEYGERFEPDFLLFIKKDKESGYRVAYM